MSFEYPYLFWILIVPFLIFAFLILTNKESVERVFSKDILERLSVDRGGLPNRLRSLIMLSAIFFMIVALSKPVIYKGERVVEMKGLSLMVALDISGSMRSKDIYPNRLEFAKVKIEQFLDNLKGDEVSLVAFANRAFVLAPFSSDIDTLKEILRGVDSSYITLTSTNFFSLIDLANSLFKNKKPKILVVFSDGGDKENINKIIEKLKKSNIYMYLVLIGTKEGAPVLDDNNKPLLYNGKIVVTQINTSLLERLKEEGGGGLIATNGEEDMKELAKEIHSKFGLKNRGKIKVKDQQELFIYPLILAAILLLIALSSLPKGSDIKKILKVKR